MEKDLTIYFTSDTHGYFSNIDYTTGKRIDTGLINCMSQFKQDGNSLIIDGGDTFQGSPFTYYLHKNDLEDICIPAQIMNFGGYQFVTLGNHDFNYGTENLAKYVSELNAKCLCANVEGIPGIEKTAVTTLANGLKIGITGIVTNTSHM